MKPGEKFYVKFFSFKIFSIKQLDLNTKKFYFLRFPLFKVRYATTELNITFGLFDNIISFVYKLWLKSRAKKSKKEIAKKFKNGKKIKISLLVSRPGMWNFDYLYKLLKNDSRFETSVVVMPDPYLGLDMTLNYIKETTRELEQKGIEVISGWKHKYNEPINFRKQEKPDVIIYSDFWKPHFCKEFYITNFLDKITILNEYGFSVMQDEMTCNFELNNLVDKYFRPTDIHLKMSQEIMKNKGQNVIAVGSPKLDPFFDLNYKPRDPWKKQDKPKKRIIWSPHYNFNTPDDMYCCNAFWELYDFMFQIADKYKDKIQIAFRPHPMLRKRMEDAWGKQASDEYFEKWENLENGQISKNSFIDLFLTSDAMIMDCCSFLAEYSAVNKPLFYTRTKTSRLNLNEFGKDLYEHIYDTNDNLKENIASFIEEVVINGNDYKKEGRSEFINKFIKPKNSVLASENIYNEIIKFLEKGEI